MDILKSASKIVLLTMTLGFIWLSFMWRIDANNFMVAFIMVLQHYFHKSDTSIISANDKK